MTRIDRWWSARGLPRAIALATALLALAPAAARATGDMFINFDDRGAGSSVTDTYAAQGVTFGHSLSGAFQEPPAIVTAPAGEAHSAPNVALISHCGIETCVNRTDGFLADPASHVDVWVGDVGNDTHDGIELCAYNSAGAQVGSCDTINVYGEKGVVFDLGVSSPNHDIASFSLDTFGADASSAAHVAIDDLSFDAPALTVTAVGLSATAGTSFSGTVAHVSDADAPTLASEYSAQIAWGDGQYSAGTVGADPAGGFAVNGTHTYATANSSYPLTVYITKSSGRAAFGSGTAHVAPAGGGPAPDPPTAAFAVYPSGPLCPNQRVQFDAHASTPGSSPIVSYTWKFFGEPPAADGYVLREDPPKSGNWQLEPLDASFDETLTTATPGLVHRFTTADLWSYATARSYDPLRNPFAALPPPWGRVILDSNGVRLTVTNADGLASTVRRLLTFQSALIDFSAPFVPDSACPHQADPTAPPAFATATPLQIDSSAVAVPFACQGAASVCGGVVTLTTVIGPHGITARVRPAAESSSTRAVVVGQAKFALAHGQHATVRVKLNQRGRALARRGRLRKLRVSVSVVHLGPGKARTVSRVVSITRRGH